jgi:hypothetical protein
VFGDERGLRIVNGICHAPILIEMAPCPRGGSP